MSSERTDGGDDAPPLVAARRRVLLDHRETVQGVLDAADAVAEAVGEGTTDRSAVVEPLRRELDDRGLDTGLIDALEDAVRAAGARLQANPVPAPPYLVVTSRGPVARGTVEDGRILLSVDAFDVEGRPPRYVRGATEPGEAVSVERRGESA